MRRLTSRETEIVSGGSHMPSSNNDPGMLSTGGPTISMPGGGAFVIDAGTSAAAWFMSDSNGNGSWFDDAASRASSLSVFTGATGGGIALAGGPVGGLIGAVLGISSLGLAALSAALQNEFEKQQDAEPCSNAQ